LRRVARRGAGAAHGPRLRPLRRGARRDGGRLGHRPVRAGREGRQGLRARRHRRQGAAVRARQGARGVPADGGRGSGQRQVADRGRGGGAVAQPHAVHPRAPRPASVRRVRDQRLVDARGRGAGHHPQPAGDDLPRGRGEGAARGPPQRLLRGCGAQPAVALVELLAALFAPDGTVAVPGFYDDVAPLTDEERAMIARTDLTPAELLEATGAPAAWGDERFSIRERVSARPTLDVNGLWGGYAGPGPKTIIPASAGAKLSSRLVADQNPERVYELLEAFIEARAPDTVRVEVRLLTTGRPALVPFDLPEMQAAVRAYERGWGHTPVFTRGGGSIPVVADIVDLMQVPVVMMGYGLDSDGLHAPNEHYAIETFERGIETAIVYLEELASAER